MCERNAGGREKHHKNAKQQQHAQESKPGQTRGSIIRILLDLGQHVRVDEHRRCHHPNRGYKEYLLQALALGLGLGSRVRLSIGGMPRVRLGLTQTAYEMDPNSW